MYVFLCGFAISGPTFCIRSFLLHVFGYLADSLGLLIINSMYSRPQFEVVGLVSFLGVWSPTSYSFCPGVLIVPVNCNKEKGQKRTSKQAIGMLYHVTY